MPADIIPRNRWREFLDGFSRSHQGWLVTLESVPTRAAPSVLLRNVPLLGVSDDQGRIVIATTSDASLTDRIVDNVTALRLDRTADGVERGLDIETAAGDLLRLRFRTVIAPELVDGVPG